MGTPLATRTTAALPWTAVTLREARHQLRLPQDERGFDNELARLIRTAQQTIEDEQDRIVTFGTFEWKLDHFPAGRSLRLPIRNAIETVSVAYTDTEGNPQAFTDFIFAGERVYPEIITNNVVFPTTQFGFAEVVTVTFDAGYPSAAEVPPDLKQAILAVMRDDGEFVVGV